MQKRPRSRSSESGYFSSDEQCSNVLPERVQGPGRGGFKDDGIRNWQEQAELLLDHNYPDWEYPEVPYMVPAAFEFRSATPDNGERTEKYVYNLLQEFGEKYKEPMFVIHSHKFKEHIDSVKCGTLYTQSKNWVNGEHDFVIIHKLYGLIFLQVKARSEKKYLEAFRNAQSQIEKDTESIKIFLEKQFSGAKRKSRRDVGDAMFRYPGFVVMPNCRRPLQGTAVSHDNGLFMEDVADVQSLRSWWLAKVAHHPTPVDPEIYKQLLIRFVALVHFSPPLNDQIGHSYYQIAKYHTPKQLEILMDSCPQQWITGPAGSGKTVLLVEKVAALAKDITKAGREERVLVLVYNKPLSEHLRQTLKEKQLFGNVIDVMTYDSFLYQKGIFSRQHFSNAGDLSHEEKCNAIESSFSKLKAKPPLRAAQYQHIFVDEGQDLYGEHWPELLKLYQNQPDDNLDEVFYFWVMFDSNQHVQPSGKENLPVRFFRNAQRLTRVLRNTENVFSLSKKYFSSVHKCKNEIKLAHTEVGLMVHWVNKLRDNKGNGALILKYEIEQILHQEVQSKDIVVLTRTVNERDKLVSSLTNRGISCQNADESIKAHEDKVIVDSIRRFKGLESKVVILFDPKYKVDREKADNQACELMYIAVSRCMCYLVIISTENGCKWLKSDQGLQFGSFSLEAQSQYRRFAPTYASQLSALALEDNERQDHRYCNPFGKDSTNYESGPPESRSSFQHANYEEEVGGMAPEPVKLSLLEERQYQQQYRYHQLSKENRPVIVAGSQILQPGDQFIPDDRRKNAFKLLRDPVSCNLAIDISRKTPNGLFVQKVIMHIEYDVYKKNEHKHNTHEYTKELRTLKRDICRDNKHQQNNKIVWKTYEEMGMLQEAAGICGS